MRQGREVGVEVNQVLRGQITQASERGGERRGGGESLSRGEASRVVHCERIAGSLGNEDVDVETSWGPAR